MTWNNLYTRCTTILKAYFTIYMIVNNPLLLRIFYLSTTHQVIFLPIQNGLYPSKWRMDGSPHIAMTGRTHCYSFPLQTLLTRPWTDITHSTVNRHCSLDREQTLLARPWTDTAHSTVNRHYSLDREQTLSTRPWTDTTHPTVNRHYPLDREQTILTRLWTRSRQQACSRRTGSHSTVGGTLCTRLCSWRHYSERCHSTLGPPGMSWTASARSRT